MAKKKSSPIKKVESETEFVFHKNDVMSEDDVVLVSGEFSENARRSSPTKKGKKPPRTMAGYRQIVVEEPNHNTANDNEMIITQAFTLCDKQCCEYNNYILGFKTELCPCLQFDTVPELDRVPAKHRKKLDDACMEFAAALFEQNIIDKQFDSDVKSTCNYNADTFIHSCGIKSNLEPKPSEPKLDLGLTLKSLLDNDTDRSRIEETLKSLLLKDSNGSLNGFTLSDLLPKDDKLEKSSVSDCSVPSDDEPFFEEFSSFEVAVEKSDKVRQKLLPESSLEPMDFILNLLQSKTKAFRTQKTNGIRNKSCPKSLRNRTLREKVEKYLKPVQIDLKPVETAESKTVPAPMTAEDSVIVDVKKSVKRNIKRKVKKAKPKRKAPVKTQTVEIEEIEPEDAPLVVDTEDSEKNVQLEKSENDEKQLVNVEDSGTESEPVTRTLRKKTKKMKDVSERSKNRRKVSRISSDLESDSEVKTSRRSQPSRTLKNSVNYYEPDDELVIDTDVEDFDKNKTDIIDIINHLDPSPNQEEEKENICFGVEKISKNDDKNEKKIEDCDEKLKFVEEPTKEQKESSLDINSEVLDRRKSIEKLDIDENGLTAPLKGPKELDREKLPLKESKIEETDNKDMHELSKLPKKDTIPVPIKVDEPNLVINESESLENLSRDPRLRARRISRDEEQKQRREKIHELEKKDEEKSDEKLKIRKRKSVDSELIYKTPLSDLHGEETRNYNSVPSRTPAQNLPSRSRDPWNRESTSWTRESSRPRGPKEPPLTRPIEPLLPAPRPKEPPLPRPKEPLLPTPRQEWPRSREPLLPTPDLPNVPERSPLDQHPSTSRSVIAQSLFHELSEKHAQLSSEMTSTDYPQNGVDTYKNPEERWSHPEERWSHPEERWSQNNVQEQWSYDNYRPPEAPSYSYNNYPRSTSPLHQPDVYKMAYFQTNNITLNINDVSQYQQIQQISGSFQGNEFPAQTSLFQQSDYSVQSTHQVELDKVDQMIPKCDGPCPESPETMPPEDDERPDAPEDEDEVLREEFRREFENGYRREPFRKDFYRHERHERKERPYQRRYDDHRRDKYRSNHKEFSRPHPRNTFNYNHRGKHNPNRSRSPDRWGPPIRRRPY